VGCRPKAGHRRRLSECHSHHGRGRRSRPFSARSPYFLLHFAPTLNPKGFTASERPNRL
jgi:hypothetical protein